MTSRLSSLLKSSIEDIFSKNVPEMRGKLKDKTVAIAGCGGLGSNAAVSLARAGIGGLILVDFDRVEKSNLNRQYFFNFDIGRFKVEALLDHIKKINSTINIETHTVKLTGRDVGKVFKGADILVEGFDNAESKKWLLEAWCKNFPERPIVMGSGLSGFGHTNDLRVEKTGKIYFCGDGKSDSDEGLCSSRVAIVANMQANVAIEILMERGKQSI